MQQPLISVIVPCYNQSIYIDECLQSVFDQTYKNWECIIVNDGSPDNTEEVALRWVEKDARFIYLKKENGGLSSARNAGIEKAKGEWILPLDCDDKIDSQYLELAAIEIKNGYDLIYFSLQLFGEENYVINITEFDKQKLLYINQLYCSCIFPKEKWKIIAGYDEFLREGLEDWEFWINMMYNTPTKIKKVDYIGFYYRRKENSMNIEMNTNTDKQVNAYSYIVKKHSFHYAENNTWVINKIQEKNRYESYYTKYEQLFSKNLFGKIVYSLLHKING